MNDLSGIENPEPLWFDQDIWWSEFWRMVRAEDGYTE